MKKYVLASNSPRRKELLAQVGLDFEVSVPDVNENIRADSPADMVCRLSALKCECVAAKYKSASTESRQQDEPADDHELPGCGGFLSAIRSLNQKPEADADEYIVIGADTVVVFEGTVLGKPEDGGDAYRMLRFLSGHTHTVYTGVTAINTRTDKKITFYEATEVTFFDIPDDELRRYVESGEPMDKAGAYGIQGKGAFLVEKINGDFYNVVGLPVARLLRAIQEL